MSPLNRNVDSVREKLFLGEIQDIHAEKPAIDRIPSVLTWIKGTHFFPPRPTGDIPKIRGEPFSSSPNASLAKRVEVRDRFFRACLFLLILLLVPASVTAATITSVTPSTGPIAGVTNVTIIGTGFIGTATVTFGVTAATNVSVFSATQINATTPAHAAGAVYVNISFVGGGTTVNKTNAFTYEPLPTFTSITPSTGPIAGVTNVTIIGTGFIGTIGITFGGTAATNVSVFSATQLNATTPAHAAGAANIVISTPNGTVTGANKFTYEPLPTFTSITPSTGGTAGGTGVILIGTGLIGTTGVTFGGTAATGISVVNATAVSAITPAHAAGAVTVALSTPNGTASKATAFTYVAASVAITLNETTIIMGPAGAMTPGNTATNATLGITVSSNEGSFSITVADNTARGAPMTGYMGNYTSGAYGVNPLNTTLASPLKLIGTTNGTTSASGTITMTTVTQLYSGSEAVTNQLLAPNTFSQLVAYTDPELHSPSVYRIDLTFTITAP